MTEATACRLGAAGAAAAIACVVSIAVIVAQEGGVSFQPGETGEGAAGFERVIGGHARGALRFFAADSGLVLGYMLAFYGLRRATATASPSLSRVGMAAGLAMGLTDLAENAFYVRQAVAALASASAAAPAMPAPDMRLLSLLTDVKEAAAWAAFGALALALPRGGWLVWILGRLMLLVPCVGAASLVWPALVHARGWTVVLPMPVLLVWFFECARSQGENDGGRGAGA